MKIKCNYCGKLIFKIIESDANGYIRFDSKCPRCHKKTVTQVNLN